MTTERRPIGFYEVYKITENGCKRTFYRKGDIMGLFEKLRKSEKDDNVIYVFYKRFIQSLYSNYKDRVRQNLEIIDYTKMFVRL